MKSYSKAIKQQELMLMVIMVELMKSHIARTMIKGRHQDLWTFELDMTGINKPVMVAELMV